MARPSPLAIAVLTTGRQDWGILRSTCAALVQDPDFALEVWTGGMHLEPAFGETVRMVEQDGFAPAERLRFGAGGDATLEAAEAMRLVGDALQRRRPDALLVLGDRSETAAAAFASVLSRVPIIHLHGGEETEGAIDNVLRHAVSKMAHLHLVSHAAYAERLRAMGEASDSIHIVGAPGLDNLQRPDLASRAELEAHLRISLASPVIVVTVHPTTLAAATGTSEVDAVVAAMDHVKGTYIITLPNGDAGHGDVRQALVAAAVAKPDRVAVDALGERRYWGLMKLSTAMLGNSSSGMIEAAALGLPVVNVGDRQKGRVRPSNVIDSVSDGFAVAKALRTAISLRFAETARASIAAFGDGHSAERIVEILRAWTPPSPARKAAIALPVAANREAP